MVRAWVVWSHLPKAIRKESASLRVAVSQQHSRSPPPSHSPDHHVLLPQRPKDELLEVGDAIPLQVVREADRLLLAASPTERRGEAELRQDDGSGQAEVERRLELFLLDTFWTLWRVGSRAGLAILTLGVLGSSADGLDRSKPWKLCASGGGVGAESEVDGEGAAAADDDAEDAMDVVRSHIVDHPFWQAWIQAVEPAQALLLLPPYASYGSSSSQFACSYHRSR